MLVTVEAQGQLLMSKVHVQATISRYKNKGGGERGAVTKFSRQSQQRLRNLMARVSARGVRKTGCKPVFLTLTYPGNMQDFDRAKRDLKVFLQRIRRAHPEASGVWKMELQKRGAIHFHLIIYSLPFTPVQDLQKMWNEVSGTNSENSLDLEIIRSISGVNYYVQKYMCKGENTKHENKLEEQTPHASDVGSSIAHTRPGKLTTHTKSHAPTTHASQFPQPPMLPEDAAVSVETEQKTGRWWGVFNRKALPLGRLDKIQIHIDWHDYFRWSLSLRNPYASNWRSFTLYTKQCYAFIWRIKQKIIKRGEHYSALAYKRWQSRGFRARVWRCDTQHLTPSFVTRLMARVRFSRQQQQDNPGVQFAWVDDERLGYKVFKRVEEPLKDGSIMNTEYRQLPLW